MINGFYTDVSRDGSNLLFRGYVDGKAVKEKVHFKPKMYLPSDKPTEFKSMDGKYLAEMDFDSIWEATSFSKANEGISNFKVYGQSNYITQFIARHFGNQCKWDRSLMHVASIDIEVEADKGFPEPDQAEYPINAITLHNSLTQTFYTWGLYDYDVKKTIVKNAKIIYTKCKDEADLLRRFVNHWANDYPDVVTGWNSRLFDMVYIVNRLCKVLDEDAANKLSPWGKLYSREVTAFGRSQQLYEIRGIQQLDYLDLFKKFAYTYGPQETYKLDHIAMVVLGERKLDYSEHGSLYDLYKNDPQKFIDYNIVDTQLIQRFEDKMGLITLCMTISYAAGVNISDAFGPVSVWDAIIYNHLYAKNIVVPPKVYGQHRDSLEGGYVKAPIVALYKWVLSFDLASLYPHIMMQYNISPETVVDQSIRGYTVDDFLDKTPMVFDKEKYSLTARGNHFRKDKLGIIPEIIDGFYDKRKAAVKSMLALEQDRDDLKDGSVEDIYALDRQIVTLNNEQMAIKILMNSLYGATSNEYFRYFDLRMAESITLTGQLTIRWVEKAINKYLNEVLKTDHDYIIAIDTDSLYINMEDLVVKVCGEDCSQEKGSAFLDKVSKTVIMPLLDKSFEELAEYLGAYEQRMSMKREVIADKGIWTGKKHYILNVLNSEGVQFAEPKIKMLGIEAVKSSTPKICRDLIKDAIYIIINNDEKAVQDYIAERKEWFLTQSAEDVSFPRGVTNVDKYSDAANIYGLRTPIHVRGALLHNHLVKEKKLGGSIERIYNGARMKYVYLKIPNELGENVIGFSTQLPPEFDLHEYVDYDMQFHKAFIEPISKILAAVGWSPEKINTLEDFFS